MAFESFHISLSSLKKGRGEMIKAPISKERSKTQTHQFRAAIGAWRQSPTTPPSTNVGTAKLPLVTPNSNRMEAAANLLVAT